MESAVHRIGAIADRPEDDSDDRIRKRSLIAMAVLMSSAGLIWGVFSLAVGLWLQALIPFIYVAITAANLTVVHQTRNFEVARLVQVAASVVLPFAFQWVFGGFVTSGGVMLWGLVAILASLTFADVRWTLRWMYVFTVLTLATALVDARAAAAFDLTLPNAMPVVAFTFNAIAISWMAFGLTIFLLARRDHAHAQLMDAHRRIMQLNESLEAQVAARTAALTEALAENEALIQHVADGLVGVSANGTLRSANPVVEDLLGLMGSPVGAFCEDVLPKEVVALGRSCHERGVIDTVTFDYGNNRVLSATASPVHTDDLKLGCVVLLRDVTHQTEVDRLKTQLAATVSHELRTPLTSVLGFTKIIRKSLETRIFPHVPQDDPKAVGAVDKTRQNLDVVVHEGERLAKLVNDVLDISKMEAGQMEWRRDPLVPKELIEQAIAATSSLFPPSRPVQIHHHLEPAPELVGDGDRLIQVLINLVSNASKFTEEGEVRVAVKTSEDGTEFAVVDTGTGIPANRIAEVFDKFRQVHEGPSNGTGLGLPICKEIVEAHGGRIWVESVVGAGTTFRFWLPQEPPAATART